MASRQDRVNQYHRATRMVLNLIADQKPGEASRSMYRIHAVEGTEKGSSWSELDQGIDHLVGVRPRLFGTSQLEAWSAPLQAEG